MSAPSLQPEPFTREPISQARVVILGLGLMGGSLALALQGKCAALYGVDPDPDALALARQAGDFDRVSAAPEELVPLGDLLILAAPVGAILSLLSGLPHWHSGEAVVIDLGSTKRQILGAMQALPARFHPIGGHPICGKERGGFQNAEAGIFQGAPFILVPAKGTTPRARQMAVDMLQAIGAVAVWMEAETHDRWMGATSHTPYLVANALAAATPAEAAPLVGPGFRSTTRLAVTPTRMMVDVLATNRDSILAALGAFRTRLSALEMLLQSGDQETLRSFLEEGAVRQTELTTYNVKEG